MSTAQQQEASTGSTRSFHSVVRAIVRTILWPLRRFFDPRFAGIQQGVEEVRRIAIADSHAATETALFTGRSLDAILAQLEDNRRRIEGIEGVPAKIDDLHRRFSFDPGAQHSVEDLDDFTARVLNYAVSHEGFAAQANLWFNPPLLVGYESQNVVLRWVNERIVEIPYTFRALSRVEPGAKVLDVGGTESTVSLSLATLGYDVTLVDPRPNPLVHERLRTVVRRVEDWEHTEPFDAVVCLSTIEHIGTGAYEQEENERADFEAMERIRELTRPGGVLVLTTAVGKGAADPDGFSRVYDRERLDELLQGWEIDDLTLVQRQDETTWKTLDEQIEHLDPGAETVAMITAIKIPT
jgi:Methyltransferase domain